jgi:2-dehydro-3-deoxyphosphogluconate aldolase/(4S)-4-hydroxy-2-oxoglutarate aldolase
MTKQEVRQRITTIGIVPVIRAATPELALAAANAVVEAGIHVVEVTMTVPGATGVIRHLRDSAPNLLVGAGTVLDTKDARACLDAGAQFLVSPGFHRPTVKLALREGVLMMAGSLTPTEVIETWRAGADIVKIFPCGNVGGPSYIKSLKAALPHIPMIPTGGVNLSTAGPFLEAGAEALGVGGELVSAGAMRSGNFAEITASAHKFMEVVKQSREQFAHVS